MRIMFVTWVTNALTFFQLNMAIFSDYQPASNLFYKENMHKSVWFFGSCLQLEKELCHDC